MLQVIMKTARKERKQRERGTLNTQASFLKLYFKWAKVFYKVMAR